jgi:hypothetical protein
MMICRVDSGLLFAKFFYEGKGNRVKKIEGGLKTRRILYWEQEAAFQIRVQAGRS